MSPAEQEALFMVPCHIHVKDHFANDKDIGWLCQFKLSCTHFILAFVKLHFFVEIPGSNVVCKSASFPPIHHLNINNIICCYWFFT